MGLLCLQFSACAVPGQGPGPRPGPAQAPTRAPVTGPEVVTSPTPEAVAPDPVGDLARRAEEQASAAHRTPGVPDVGESSPDAPGTATRRRVIGADAGWPQCPAGMGIPQKRAHGGPMPLEDSAFVVLGLTNGPGFTPNPCLASQVGWVRDRQMLLGAYAVVSYPQGDDLARYGDGGPWPADDRTGRLRNVGYAQARYAHQQMEGAGLDAPGVWVDVEPVPDFAWSADPAENAAVVQGVVRGWQDAGLRVGVYSTPALWRGVVGDLRLGLPEWRAAGQTSIDEALSRCAGKWVVQGGPVVMTQWVEQSRDRNVVCPGVTDHAAWFTR